MSGCSRIGPSRRDQALRPVGVAERCWHTKPERARSLVVSVLPFLTSQAMLPGPVCPFVFLPVVQYIASVADALAPHAEGRSQRK
jgi:hypothetical protein